MRKFLLLTTLAAAVVFAAGITVQAQTYGPDMMGNDQDNGSHRGYSPGYGMTGGGYGPGYMMGGSGYGPGMMDSAPPMTAIDAERAIAANNCAGKRRVWARRWTLRALQQLIVSHR